MSFAARTESPARERTERQGPSRVGFGLGLVDLRDEPIPAGHGVQAILAVVLGLLALYLAPVFLTGAGLPVGSDAAYDAWMSRLAGRAVLAAIAVLLADRRRVSLALSVALLVAAGLAHGAFFAFALLVLGGAIVLRWLWPGAAARTGRATDAGRLVALGAGSAAMIAGLV